MIFLMHCVLSQQAHGDYCNKQSRYTDPPACESQSRPISQVSVYSFVAPSSKLKHCNYQLISCHSSHLYQRFHCTLGEKVLAGRKFGGIGGILIWRMQINVNLADGRKHIFWRELNLALNLRILPNYADSNFFKSVYRTSSHKKLS